MPEISKGSSYLVSFRSRDRVSLIKLDRLPRRVLRIVVVCNSDEKAEQVQESLSAHDITVARTFIEAKELIANQQNQPIDCFLAEFLLPYNSLNGKLAPLGFELYELAWQKTVIAVAVVQNHQGLCRQAALWANPMEERILGQRLCDKKIRGLQRFACPVVDDLVMTDPPYFVTDWLAIVNKFLPPENCSFTRYP